MDEDLVHLANSLPSDWKHDGRTGKRVLKDAFRNDLPESVFNRPKHGFEVPLRTWLAAAKIESAHPHWLDPAYISDQGLFNAPYITAQFAALYAGRSSTTAAVVWAYIVFQHWHDRMTALCRKY
jgi:asparagine synthase (glutamine-hydrolysing)